MSKLDKSVLPFSEHSGTPEKGAVDIHPDTDKDFLLDTALNAYPEIWADYAASYIQQNPDFLKEYGLIMPGSEDDDFDAFEILAMQIATRRDALQGLKEAFIQNGQSENIIADLLQHPVMQHRIQAGEPFPISENRSYDAA